MARPIRILSPEAQALWDRAAQRFDAGEITIDDLCRMLGFGKTTIYERLREARLRREDAERDGSPPPSSHLDASDREPPPDLDEVPWLAIVDDVRDTIRPVLDFTSDPYAGEVRYEQRHHYVIATLPAHEAQHAAIGRPDPTSLDGTPTSVFMGGGAIQYGSVGAGRNRLPTPPLAGQRLKRSHLDRGEMWAGGKGDTKHEPDKDGKAGGTGLKPGEKPWWVVTVAGSSDVLKVQGNTQREAKRAVKRLFGLAMSEPLDPSMRFQRQA